ncbi:MAG: transposase [Gammaproteobacteria bacterium]|nr:transposase [Gammaproteobacteria bacterium]NIR58697.1 transposase [Gammaproteobacteria bacterium]NIR90358.1 transposase [Gammaproteobacteria bacterium]
MPNYRRDYSGTVWFFTVVTRLRRPLFGDPNACRVLGRAVRECRACYPFDVDAWVLLPDHMHAIWTLPASDLQYSRRWALIKRRFTQTYRARSETAPPFWQDRFWAHRIDDNADYRHHMDYVHYNPVKHGFTARPGDWPWTSFRRLVANGIYPGDWGDGITIPECVGNE